MSRYYQYELSTFDAEPALTREQAIEVAKAWSELCEEEVRTGTFNAGGWEAESGRVDPDTSFVAVSPTVQLAGGEGPEDDIRHYIEAVWRAAGCFVDGIVATVIFIEHAPTEGVDLDNDDYAEWLAAEPPPCPTCGSARRQCETGGDGCWHCDTCDAAGREPLSPPGSP
jgi:hypothetical protein